MKTNGRIVAIAAALVLLFTACGGDGGGSQGPKSVKAEDVQGVVKVAATVGVNEPIMRALEPEFEKVYPNIDIQVVGINYLNVFEKQLVGLKAGSGDLDIITHTPSFFSIYAANDYLEPLQPFIDSDLTDPAVLEFNDFAQSLVTEANTANGELLGLPFIEFPVVYIYRTDLLANAGLEVPTTLDAMMESSKALHNSPDVYGNTVQGTVGGAGANTWNWYPFLFSFGGDILDEGGQPIINSPEAVQALQYYVDLYKCCSPPESINWDNSSPYEPLQAGKLAQLVTDADTYPQIQGAGYDFGVAQMPAGPAGSIALAGSWSNSINRYSEDKEAAWLFLQFIASRDAMDSYIQAGGIPPKMSVLTGGDNELFTVVAKALETAKGLPKVASYMEMEDAIGRAIAAALAEEKTPQEALDGAQAELQQLLQG